MWLKTHFNKQYFIFPASMHDSIFEHEINVFSTNEIHLMDLMEGFRHSYVFYSIRMLFFSIRIIASSPRKMVDNFFCLRKALPWRTVVWENLHEPWELWVLNLHDCTQSFVLFENIFKLLTFCLNFQIFCPHFNISWHFFCLFSEKFPCMLLLSRIGPGDLKTNLFWLIRCSLSIDLY